MPKPEDKNVQKTRQKQIKAIDWTLLGEGSFNRVYDSRTPYVLPRDGEKQAASALPSTAPTAPETTEAATAARRWVKRERYKWDPLSHPERVYRLFQAIEPDLPVFIFKKKALVLPHLGKAVGGREASQEEKAQKCIDVFKATGRIILDAGVPENFFYFEGHVYLTDPDMAVRPDSPTSVKGFFKIDKKLKKYKKLPWYEAIRHYDGFPTNEHYFVSDLTKVLLGLIDLAEHFSEDQVPEQYLTVGFLIHIFDQKKARRPLESILDDISQVFMADEKSSLGY